MKVVDALAESIATEGVEVAVNLPDEVTIFLAQALSLDPPFLGSGDFGMWG